MCCLSCVRLHAEKWIYIGYTFSVLFIVIVDRPSAYKIAHRIRERAQKNTCTCVCYIPYGVAQHAQTSQSIFMFVWSKWSVDRRNWFCVIAVAGQRANATKSSVYFISFFFFSSIRPQSKANLVNTIHSTVGTIFGYAVRFHGFLNFCCSIKSLWTPIKIIFE